jgi:Zn finger protein HypA/HybF involved in hydrogenase expression
MQILCIFLLAVLFVRVSQTQIVQDQFNHQAHLERALNGVQCKHCHNFSLNEKTNTIELNEAAKISILRMPVKQICHECHNTSTPHQNAPQTCFTCHSSTDAIKKIKPQNHINLTWKTSHSLEARVQGESCLNCHVNSQCAKCHLQKNNFELKNHSRNFKYFHSVQARATPQKCDTCHSKTFCIDCHLGKK